MNMKKFIARKAFPVICAAFISVVIAGCGDDSSNSTPSAPATTDPVVTPSDSTTTNPVADPVKDPSADPATNPSTDPATDPVTNPENPTQNPTTTDTTAKDPVVNPDTSTTPTDPVTKVTVNRDPAAAGLVLAADSNGFYDVGDIYKAVPAESKIVFVLRPLIDHQDEQRDGDGDRLGRGEGCPQPVDVDFGEESCVWVL